MVQDIFINLSIIIILAVVISGIMRLLKQPLLIGYIITGILAGPLFLGLISSETIFDIFAKLGVALLLFMVGLHLNPKVIKEVGKVSLFTGLGQVIFTSIIGFLIAKTFGFSNIAAIYIAVALTFSSTIIIMKLLSDTKQIDSLHGKIAVGFLIVQDLVAIFALMIISSLSYNASLPGGIVATFFKGIIALIIIIFLTYFFFPKLTKSISNSQEFLFLFSIGWCLALSSLFFYMGFSIEIGALIAGVTLSITPYAQEISAKTKPLRDFFIVLFFVILGSQMIIGDITGRLIEITLFSLFILIGNPLIVMIIMGYMGFTKRTGFLAGLTVAQISEFSLILIALGMSVGHLSQEILSVVTTVGLITITGSTYMIIYSNKLYPLLSPCLSIFEKKKLNRKKEYSNNYDIILFGYNRTGFGILNALKAIKKKYLVVDFNPEIVNNLSKSKIPCVYGDAYDNEFISGLPLEKAKIIISTVPDLEVNLLLLKEIKKINPNATIILRAHTIENSLELYKNGATYVLTPHFLGGEHIAKLILEKRIDKKGYEIERKKHLELLKKIEK